MLVVLIYDCGTRMEMGSALGGGGDDHGDGENDRNEDNGCADCGDTGEDYGMAGCSTVTDVGGVDDDE